MLLRSLFCDSALGSTAIVSIRCPKHEAETRVDIGTFNFRSDEGKRGATSETDNIPSDGGSATGHMGGNRNHSQRNGGGGGGGGGGRRVSGPRRHSGMMYRNRMWVPIPQVLPSSISTWSNSCIECLPVSSCSWCFHYSRLISAPVFASLYTCVHSLQAGR